MFTPLFRDLREAEKRQKAMMTPDAAGSALNSSTGHRETDGAASEVISTSKAGGAGSHRYSVRSAEEGRVYDKIYNEYSIL